MTAPSAGVHKVRSTQRLRTPSKTSAKSAAPSAMPEALLGATTHAETIAVPARKALSFEGQGAPEGEAFQRGVAALYGVTYALKFSRKGSGRTEFKVGPLEGRWWAAQEGSPVTQAPRNSWRWRLRMAVPDDVTPSELAETVRAAMAKKGSKLERCPEGAKVVLEMIPPQRLGRALHLGPYAEEGRTFVAIDEAMRHAGLTPGFTHLEIYLNDPTRTAPARLKTVLLRETR